MIHVSMRRVIPGKEARLREWLAELKMRSAEVAETWDQEGVRSEKAYIIPGDVGQVLIYVSEAEDLERARAAFAASELPVDVQHRAVMAECLGERLGLPPAFELDR